MSKKGQNKENYEEIKVILIGESGVGKSNLIQTSVGNKFEEHKESTINASFETIEMNINGKQYKINLWDTAGQEMYLGVTKLFFKGSNIVILVYDITNSNSFESLKKWLKITKETIDNNYIIGIVGNKNDLYLNLEVSEEDVKNYAESIESKYAFVSAKTQSQLFVEFVKELVKDYKDIEPEDIRRDRRCSMKLNKKKTNKKQGCC